MQVSNLSLGRNIVSGLYVDMSTSHTLMTTIDLTKSREILKPFVHFYLANVKSFNNLEFSCVMIIKKAIDWNSLP